MNALRPMGVGDILDAALNLYRRKFRTFLAIVAVGHIPYAVVMAFLGTAVRRAMPQAPAGDDGNLFNVTTLPLDLTDALRGIPANFSGSIDGPAFSLIPVLVMVALFLLAALLWFGLIYPLCTGALVVNISAGYLGEDLSARESYARAMKRLGRLLTAQFLVSLLLFVGFMVCVVPVVFVFLWFMLVPVVVLLEDNGASASLGRSRTLMEGNLWKGFLLLLVVWLLSGAFSAAGDALIRIVPWPTEFLASFLSNLLPAFVLPLSLSAIVLLYYDLRIRKEAFDLQVLASRMEAFREP